MIQLVRQGLFETNSSSTHTLTICTKKEFEAWKQDKMLLHTGLNAIIPKVEFTKEELRDSYIEDKAQELDNGYVWQNKYYDSLEAIKADTSIDPSDSELAPYKRSLEYDLQTYNDYLECCEGMEYSEIEYTSPSGDELVGFGYGGYDG